MADEWDLFIVSGPEAYAHDGELRLETDSACDVFRRLYEEANTKAAAGVGADRQAMVQAERQCHEEQARRIPKPPAPPPVTPQRPKTPATPKAPMTPKAPIAAKEDSPREQDAPDIPATMKVTRVPSPGKVDEKRPTDSVFDRQDPKPPSVVASIMRPQLTQTGLDDLLRRLERNEPEPGEPHPTHSGPAPARPVGDGDPVDLFSGALALASVDLVVPTPLLPIQLERHYRSGRPYWGPFGFGWDHNYNVFLRPLADGGVAVWTGPLAERRFLPVAGGWEPESGLTARLTAVAGGYEMTHPLGPRWRFTRPAGWTDGARTPLTAVVDRHGNALQLDYDGENRVAAVRDGAGRGLLFHYGQCGLLERVTDHTERRVIRYDHDGEAEHLVRVIQPATAQYPDGVTTRYEYDTRAGHPAMRHNVLRLVDAAGRVALDNTYAGPEDGWAFNGVVRQLAADFEYRFAYEPIQYVPSREEYLDVPAMRTCVRRPDGGLHTYTFNWRGDLIDHRFRLNRDRTARVVVSRQAYDAMGNVVESVGPDGLRMVSTYDSANPDPCARRNLLRQELAAPVPGVVGSRTLYEARYEARYQLPTEVFQEGLGKTRLRYDFDTAPAGATGRLARVELPAATLADGTVQPSVLTFEHNPVGQPVAIVSAEGRRVELRYLSGGLTDKFLAASVEDPAGSALTSAIAYDPLGLPQSLQGPGGRTTGLRSNLLGQVEEVAAPAVDGRIPVVRRWFDDSGGVVKVVRPGPQPGQEVTDEIVRDAQGAVRRLTTAAGSPDARQWRSTVDADGRPAVTVDPTGLRTDRLYGENGTLIKEMVGVGTAVSQTSTYAYDLAGRVTKSTGPFGEVTRVAYDVWGRAHRITQPDGAMRTLEYGPGDQVISETVAEADGTMLRRATVDYDERGRRRSVTQWAFDTDPATATPLTTTYLYDADDNVVAIRPPRGPQWTFTYDTAGRMMSVTDPGGGQRRLAYDTAGDLVSMTIVEPGATTTHLYAYDGRGRLIRTDALGRVSEVRYDDRDIPVVHITNGVTVALDVDVHEQVTAAVLDPAGLALRTSLDYDAAGQPVRYTDPAGRVTTWQRDLFGQPVAVTGPDGTTWRSETDSVQRLIRRWMPSGNQLTMRFVDSPQRPTAAEVQPAPGYDPVPAYAFGYDGLGRLVRAADGLTEVRRRYDSIGRIVAETVAGQSVTMSYDDVAGTADLVFPDGRREQTELAPDGRPTRIVLANPGALGGTAGDMLLELTYSATGRLAQLTHGNGVVAHLVHDEMGRLIRLDYESGGALLDSCRVRYDADGHRALVQYLGAPADSILHGFDDAGRLVETRWGLGLGPLADAAAPLAQAAYVDAVRVGAGGAPGVAYDLDGGDGRTGVRGINGGSPDLAYVTGADHRVVQAGPDLVGYGPDGERTQDGRFRYEYDALGRVVRVVDRTTGTVEQALTYDALSRVRAGTSSGTPFERWYAAGSVVQETIGGAVRQISPHPVWPTAMCTVDSGGVRYDHPDDAWSTMLVTDAAGAVHQRFRYDTFGAATAYAPDGTAQPGPPTGHTWRGMLPLGQTSLYATPQRAYDPALGSFLGRDPLLYADSPSPYVFAGHNPADYADPTGWAKSALGVSVPSTALRPPVVKSNPVYDFVNEVSKGVWWYNPHHSDLIPQVPPVDTGWIVANFLVNRWIGVSNLLGQIVNLPGNLVWVVEDIAKRLGFSQTEIQAFHDLSMIGLVRLPSIFQGIGYLSNLFAESSAWRRLSGPAAGIAAAGGAAGAGRRGSRAAAAAAAEFEGPPVFTVELYYEPVFKMNPTVSSWLKAIIEWGQSERGYFVRGVRLPEDGRLRGMSRKWMDIMGFSRENLQAGHPIDDLMGALWRRQGNVGTTYFYYEREINGRLGGTVSQQLNMAGLREPGRPFQVRFTGDWPDPKRYPPTAPIASPPDLTWEKLRKKP